MNHDLMVSCTTAAGGGWICRVKVGTDASATVHEVSVSEDELSAFAPGADEPTALVRHSFEFMLEREPRESILRSFELSAIETYFPEYRNAIRRAHSA